MIRPNVWSERSVALPTTKAGERQGGQPGLLRDAGAPTTSSLQDRRYRLVVYSAINAV